MNEVTIRFIEERDAPSVQEYASDEAVSMMSNVPYPYPENAADQWTDLVIKRRQAGVSYAFAVLVDGEFSGVMTLNAVDYDEGRAELDYWIARHFWNKGIATKAAARAIKYAFTELGLKTLMSACLERNFASRKVLEKSGFIHIFDFTFDRGKFKGEVGKRYQLNGEALCR